MDGMCERNLNIMFCAHFVHAICQSERGQILPYQVPMSVRCTYDRTYLAVRNKMHVTKDFKRCNLTKWIVNREGPCQGMYLIALLEIFLDQKNFPECLEQMREVRNYVSSFAFMNQIATNQLSNFLATCIRVVGCVIRNDEERIAQKKWIDILTFSESIWIMCRDKNILEDLLSLFGETVNKLENIDISLCLWFFLRVSRSFLVEDECWNEQSLICRLCRIILNALCGRERVFEDLAWIPIALTVLQFLQEPAHRDFFESLHCAMITFCGKKNWISVWKNDDRFFDLCEYWEAKVALSNVFAKTRALLKIYN